MKDGQYYWAKFNKSSDWEIVYAVMEEAMTLKLKRFFSPVLYPPSAFYCCNINPIIKKDE